MKRILSCLCLILFLTGCTGSSGDSSPPPEKEEQRQQQTQVPEQTPPEDPAPPEVSLVWESVSQGVWPFEQTVELLQFSGSELPELLDANDEMLENAENQMAWFEAAYEKGEDLCYADGDSWGSLWAYPVTTDRYLSAVTVQREHMQFRIDDPYSWNIVSSNFVYDKEEQRLISLDEALDRMDTSVGDLAQAIWEFTANQNIGTYEDLSSIGFYMDPEGYPVFIIGAVVYGHGPSVGWPTFFNWDNGEIRWSGEEPLPLYLVDTAQDGLACLAGMGQYDGAAIISEEEAFETLGEIAEVQDFLSQGMTMVSYGITETIDGEEHLCIELGTNYNGQFVSEQIYAVSWYSVYCMDPVSGGWIPVGFG
jgi:hypothetical protein